MARKGFTLIELLVVISIIALLSSVVLASLNAAREKARLAGAKRFAATSDRAQGDQAVALWDFDDCSPTTAIDRSGWGNTANLVGNPSSPLNTPIGGGCALGLDGSTQYANIPMATLEAMPQGTISVWVNLNSNINGTITAKQHDSVNSYAILSVGYLVNTGGSGISATPGVVYWHGSNANQSAASASAVPTGRWAHIAVVFSNTQVTFYVDGKFDGTTMGDYSIPSDPFPTATTIGRWQAARYLSGSIDSLHIFSKLLTARQVKDLYAAESSRFANLAVERQ